MSRYIESILRDFHQVPVLKKVLSKECSACGEVKDGQAFHPNKGGGKISSSRFCKDCRRRRRKEVGGERLRNQQNAAGRKSYRKNLGKNKIRSKAYYAANKHRKKPLTPEQRLKRLARSKERWWENRDFERARSHDYYAANKDKVETRIREWRRLNPEAMRYYWSVRRARVRGLKINITRETTAARVELFGHSCSYCGGAFEHLDHVKAVSRNGMHCPANLRPACKACNLRKGMMSIKDWKRLSGQWTGIPTPNLPPWW